MTFEAAHLPAMPYSFETFIVAPSNKAACKAAKMVSENAAPHNLLYIYGGRGVGKTHLLRAIENHVMQHRSALCITGEKFTNEFIDSVYRGHGDQFRSKYRDIADCFLMDDVHFLAGKSQVQEELLYVLHSLNQKGAQIVVAAHVPPQDIPCLDIRLLQHFEKGLIVEIQPPDNALKHKMLMQYIRQCHGDIIPIPDDVLEYVVQNYADFHALLQRVNTHEACRIDRKTDNNAGCYTPYMRLNAPTANRKR